MTTISLDLFIKCSKKRLVLYKIFTLENVKLYFTFNEYFDIVPDITSSIMKFVDTNMLYRNTEIINGFIGYTKYKNQLAIDFIKQKKHPPSSYTMWLFDQLLSVIKHYDLHNTKNTKLIISLFDFLYYNRKMYDSKTIMEQQILCYEQTRTYIAKFAKKYYNDSLFFHRWLLSFYDMTKSMKN